MKKFTLILLFTISTLANANDMWLFTPGHSFGKITKQSTFKSIQAMYGVNKVVLKKIHLGEGEYSKGIIVFPNEKSKTIEIILNKNGNLKNIIMNSKQTLWHTAEGITIGSTLNELEKLNKKSFMLFGFGWDYSGTISDWKNGYCLNIKTC